MLRITFKYNNNFFKIYISTFKVTRPGILFKIIIFTHLKILRNNLTLKQYAKSELLIVKSRALFDDSPRRKSELIIILNITL